MNDDYDDKSYTLRIGSLILHNIGQLLPHQIQSTAFHSRSFIYPVSLIAFLSLGRVFMSVTLGRLYSDTILLVDALPQPSVCLHVLRYRSRG